MEVENSVDVEFAASIAANVAANPVVGTNTTEDLTLTVNRREYVVVGDDTYISRTTDTPQWLVTLIESLTALQLDAAFADVADLHNALDTAIAAMNVAKNEYAMAIINYSDLEQIVNAKIETLNSTLREADATIIDVLSTRVTADQASALAVQSIAASMAGGSIKAAIDLVKSSVVTETQSRAIAIDGVRAELYGLADTVGITAGAVQVLESSVSLVDGPIKSALVGIQGSVTALEAQIDGVVETTTGTYEPLDLATGTLILWQDAPTNTVKTLYKEWLDALTLDAHIGDTYVLVQTVEGVDTYAKSWKFQKGSAGANNTDANGYGWFPVTNSTAIEALAKAVEAKDLADGKRRVFTATPYPPYDQGDLWVQGTSGDLMRCQTAKVSTGLYSASDWVKATKYTDDTALDMFVSGTFTSTLTEINTQLDQKAVAYYAPNMPHGEVALAAESAEYNGYVSDLWYKTVDDFKTYIYTKTHNIAVVEDSGTVLEAVATAEINGMLVDAITTYEDSGSIVGIGGTYDGQYYYQWLETPLPKYLFDKIDGKKTIYTAQPSSYDINDLWIPQTAVVGFVTKEIYVATRTSAIFVASDWIVASNYSAQIEAVDIRLTQTEIDAAILDGKITDEEEARIAAVLAEQQARLDAIAERVNADNMLDGKLTAEELARANAIDAVSAAYKEYSRIVTLAIADGVLTEDEQTLITSAAAAVEAAKQRFEVIETDVDAVIGALDSFIDTTNPRLDNSVTIYNQTTAPTFATEVLRNAAHGDIWIDTDAVVASKYWRYNAITSSWVSAPDLVNVFADLTLKGNVTYRTIDVGVGSTIDSPITGIAPSDFDDVTEVGGFFGTTNGTRAGDTLLVTYWYKKDTADAKLVTDMYLWNGSSWGVAGVSAAAKSKWAIDQEIELAGLGVDITATNGLVTALDGKIDDTKASVQSKFAYNSQLKIGPYAYNTGFGLDTTGSTQLGTAVVDGETLPLWSSKFWIKADEFKMVAANQTAPAQSPFEVNATTGDITFRGKVSFSNIVDAEKPSSNLLSNSAPAFGSETAMWEQGFYTTSPAPSGIGAGFDVWRPTGTGSVFNSVSGVPAVGSVFDINQIGTIAVIGGSRYEATSLLSAHRCNSYCNIVWYSVAGAYIGESIAGSVNVGQSHGGALSNWVRYGGFVTAPLNAAFCRFTVRSSVTSTDPYCFVAQAYFGRATTTQIVFSDWIEGAGISGAGVATAINTNTTTINGSKITVGSIAADRIDTSLLTLGGLGTSYARVSKDGIQVVVNGVTRVKLGLL